MSVVDNAAAAAYLKQRFSPKRIRDLTFPRGPAYAMLPKRTDFGGENLKLPVSYADLKGVSADFSVAQANKASSSTSAFEITTVEDYALFSIAGKTVRQSQGNMNAWLPSLEKETKSAFKSLGRRNSIGVFRNSVGYLSTIHASTTLSSTTLQFANRGDVASFETGMSIYFANPTGHVLRDSGKALSITAIDRDAGTCTVSAALNTVAGIALADEIIPEGDLNNRISGFDDWIPSTAPSATLFFAVNRSVDTVRLGGIRYNATGETLEEALLNAAVRSDEEGGVANAVFIPPDLWRSLVNSLGSKKEYMEGKGAYWDRKEGAVFDASIGFTGIKILGPAGTIGVYSDRHCQANTGWMLQTDTWTFHSSGDAPGWLDEDDNNFLRENNADAYEGRVGEYMQLHCDAPGYNVRILNLGA